MALHGSAVFPGCLLLLVFLQMHLSLTMSASDCPLDLSRSNFTLAASKCSIGEDRAKCCRHLNALVAISVSRYANVTSNLGVTSNLSDVCLRTISETFALHGITRNASVFCSFGTKIPVNYECQGRSTVNQMLQSPKFRDVTENCKVPLSEDGICKKCLNAGIVYLHNLLGPTDNLTLSTCRDAAFAAVASQVDYASTIGIASCFFAVQGLNLPPGSFPSSPPPQASPTPLIAASPAQLSSSTKGNHQNYHLSLVPSIGIAVTALASVMLVVLIILIRKKRRELDDSDTDDKTSSKSIPRAARKFQDGPSSMFRKFGYRDTRKATDNFNTIIGQGGFGTVYKARFHDGLVVAVKQMNMVSKQAEDEFCREIELLARLHHRHLVSLRGFCIKRHERFLMYEYMENGSLKDHLLTPTRPPLSWRARIQIAIDVANALEYLHFYCNPPLCHRDIKSSNILLDENFVAKVADFGLAHASKDGSVCFEPVNTDIRGTPGYMDPEYVVTRELTEKSDIYSYGVVLLELVTARRAIQDNTNLVEWSQPFLTSEFRITELVDPNLRDAFDFDQLQTIVEIVKWCTQKEGRARPSIKQVLRLLYESTEVMHSGFVEAMEDEEYGETEGRGRTSRGNTKRGEGIFFSGDVRGLASSSSTSRSYCSRSFLLETGSPQSPHNIPSI
ncbi:probable receptor-like protein kinase At1g49730 isoform X1 [Olea europaea var. sylvestris]|uniref:probable receptor-like protein kinase At1g49730 isoform X1 n=1 Tax=Olea europaea var. sylvestris TaxID=158386 RepID=UPI000C1D854E|nr:probable receptor-like protein kinase At1g49730 isoform X1 [Olea europaea var. sylvestris]